MYIAKQRFLNLGIAKFVLRYVGQQQIPVPRTPSKGGDPVHYLSVLVEKSEIKPNSNTLPYFYHIIGVNTVLVENVSSTETLPTRGPAPEINPTDNNALLVSAEKVKIKVVSEILPPKV